MLDIKKVVGEFAAQRGWFIKDERIEALMDSKDASELYFLATPRYFDSEANWRRTFVKWHWEKRWYLACAIDLGPILGDSDFKPVLYGLSREPVGLVLFAQWINGRRKAQDRRTNHIDVANGICSQEYGAFLAACEACVDDGIEPVYSSSFDCWLQHYKE